MVMFVWGASVFFAMTQSARRHAEHLRRRQAVDVEAPAPRRPARDQRAARAGRPAGEADDDLAGRDPQLLRPGLPRSSRTCCPAATRTIWFQPTKPGRYHLFCAEYCGTKHSGMIGWVVVMEPADYQAWLSGGARRGLAGVARARSCSSDLACTTCHRADAQRPRPRARRGCSARPSTLQSGETVVGRRSLHPRVDPAARSRRSSPATSRSCRPSRGRSARSELLAADRIHQVAAGRSRGDAAAGEPNGSRAEPDDQPNAAHAASTT